jgi:nucleotide-binding universal stress UspA family protein
MLGASAREVPGMLAMGSRTTPYLALDELEANPQLARRLPAELALRFHALPLAEDNGRITIAMADPDDPNARAAVLEALGVTACIVQCDSQAIDRLLARIWGQERNPPPCRSICVLAGAADEGPLWNYAGQMGRLLDAEVRQLDVGAAPGDAEAGLGEPGPDLVLLGRREPALVPLLLRIGKPSLPGKHAPEPPSTGLRPALLIADTPRWPLRRILLVLCGAELDGAAVAWALRLARDSHSSVSMLAVVPPGPAKADVPALLAAKTALGHQMREAAHQLVTGEIEGTLRIRQGEPLREIGQEVLEGDYDLVAIASQTCPAWRPWLKDDLATELLRWIDRPVLVVGSATE